MTKRSLLASLMALSLLCGGLGVAEAAVVHVNEVAGGTSAVYTTDETYTKTEADAKYAKATDVTANTTNIGTNKAAIEDLKDNKLDKTLASATFATKDALNNLTATVNDKADEAAVTTALDGKADKATTLAGYGITDAYTKGDVDDKLNAKADAANVFTKDQTYTRDQVNTKLADYAKSADVYTKTDADAKFATSGALTTAKTELDQKIDNEIANRITSDTALDQKIDNEIANRITSDTALDQKIDKEIANRITSDTALDQKIDKEIQDRENAIKDTNDRTGGIARNTEKTQTTIEGSVKVDKQGNVKDVNELSAKTITTTGNADLKGNVTLGTNTSNTVTVNGKSDFNEAVNMDNGLTVTNGDTTLQNTDVKGALNVSGESNLKNTTVDGTLSVNKETTLNGKLTAKDEATFKENVTMEKDLEVKGELKTDKISMKNTDTDADGTIHRSATTITADGITHIGEVEKSGVITKSQFTHTEEGSETYAKKGDATDWTETRSDVTADGVKTEVKDSKGNRTNTSQTKEGINGFAIDEDGNSSTTSQTASKNTTYLTDKDGKNTNNTIDTAKEYDKTIKGENGQTSTKQDELNITNTAEQGTIKNDAMNIENNASGNITNNAQNGTIKNDAKNIVNNASENITTTAKTMDTTVTGKATESYGELDTTVNGMEKHTVNGKQINTVTEGQTNNITGGQTNNITGDQTTIVTNGSISNTANNITNTANEKLTDQVGTNTRVIDSDSITDSVGTKTNRKIEDGKITDTAGAFTVTTDETNGTTFAKTGSTAAYSTKAGAPTDTNIAGNHISTGRVDANELSVSDEDGDNTADFSVKAGEGVKASAGNGTTTGSLDVKADEVVSSVKDASGKGSTFKQRIDKIMMESKDVSIKAEETLTNEAKDIVTNASNSITEKVGETNVTTKTTTSSKSEIQNADTITSVQQTENMVQSYVGKKDGSATNVTTNSANASANMVTQDGQASTVLNNKDGLLVRNTANGRSFITADGTNTGAALEWTNVKGNEISTGKVEANYVKMDYADVMKDLGVHGNAKVDQNLEVGGTSTLKGDVTMESNAKVKKDLTVEGTTTTKTLKVTENAEIDGTLKVAKKATFEDSVSIAKDLSVGGDVTANSYKVGDKTYISAAGINANDQKITNVADGSISEGSKDAVNGGQLYGVKRDLEHQVDKVGANAAAMANLRPMEFDPSSKWNIAAAIGNYGSETAAALGAFYRPNDNVMVNLSTAFGTGENMVGGGVSVRLGKGGNKLSREETNALKAQVADLTARMDALLSVLNPNMSKDFPDVPENHWAYEAVSRLAGNDIVQGYPDGEFHGERTMTRYEMAEIIYNALSRGAEAERELVEEFKPELQAMAASEKATAEKAEG